VPVDLLRMPFVGGFLRHRAGRPTLQLFVAGGRGDRRAPHRCQQIAPRNLATVLTIHWRGLILVAIAAAGTLHGVPDDPGQDTGRCTTPGCGCAGLRQMGGPVLLVVVLFAYERFDCGAAPPSPDHPGLLVAAVAIDTAFAHPSASMSARRPVQLTFR
jgi:hypothetical protein